VVVGIAVAGMAVVGRRRLAGWRLGLARPQLGLARRLGLGLAGRLVGLGSGLGLGRWLGLDPGLGLGLALRANRFRNSMG